jgi:hypothetical protein
MLRGSLLWPDFMQGALGINTSLFAFSFVVCNFLSNATTPLVAGALASGDKRQVRPTLSVYMLYWLQWLADLCATMSSATADSFAQLQAGRVTLQALAVAAVLGTAIALALIWGAERALSTMGADLTSGPLHDLSLEYLRIRWGLSFNKLTQHLQQSPHQAYKSHPADNSTIKAILLPRCRATAAPAALVMLVGQGVLRGQVCQSAV